MPVSERVNFGFADSSKSAEEFLFLKNSIIYKSLYDKIINVGEFKNPKKINMKNLLGSAESHY